MGPQTGGPLPPRYVRLAYYRYHFTTAAPPSCRHPVLRLTAACTVRYHTVSNNA